MQYHRKWTAIFLMTLTAHGAFSQFVFPSGGRPMKRNSQYRFQVIRRHIETSIINDVFPVDTRQECVYSCAQVRSMSLYYIPSSDICHCNIGLDVHFGNITGFPEIIYGEMENLLETLDTGLTANVLPQLSDCLELYQNGVLGDGVYAIYPVGGDKVYAWCDMRNGGWTVFQRRQGGSEDFYRTWDDYVTGFGDKSGNYWLGLENIHLLTKERSELHIFMEAFEDGDPASGYAQYDNFAIGNNLTMYQLALGTFTGDCGDALSNHNGMMFTTLDNDNDASEYNCAIRHKGGWWYNACHQSNLNGFHLGGDFDSTSIGMNWCGCWDITYSLKNTVMKTRRL